MVGWSNEETFKLIELYQQEPVIWNPKNKFHKDKIKINDAWLRIADALGIPVAEVKKKKESLMAAFRYNHKRIKSSQKSGAGQDQIFKPIWIFYDALAAFILDVYDCKAILNTEDDVQDEMSSLQSSSEYSHGTMNDEDTENVAPESTIGSSPVSSPVQKRRSHKPIELQETNTQVQNALTTLNNVLNKKQNEDECDLYGKLIAEKLRQYTGSDRDELMYEIEGIFLKKRRSVDDRSSSISSFQTNVTSPSQIINTNPKRPMATNVTSPSQIIIKNPKRPMTTNVTSPSQIIIKNPKRPMTTNVKSPSQIIITNHKRPITQQSTRSKISQPVYIIGNRHLSSQYDPSVLPGRPSSTLSSYSMSSHNSIDCLSAQANYAPLPVQNSLHSSYSLDPSNTATATRIYGECTDRTVTDTELGDPRVNSPPQNDNIPELHIPERFDENQPQHDILFQAISDAQLHEY